MLLLVKSLFKMETNEVQFRLVAEQNFKYLLDEVSGKMLCIVTILIRFY